MVVGDEEGKIVEKGTVVMRNLSSIMRFIYAISMYVQPLASCDWTHGHCLMNTIFCLKKFIL